MKNYIYLLCFFFSCISCTDSSQITSAKAENLVKDYLEHTPQFETAHFYTKEMKLKSNKDTALIATMQRLEENGYIEMVNVKSRKKWFSKDSVYFITPALTQKSLPYVVKQQKNKTEVITLNYEIDETQNVNFERKDKKVATFNVVLLKNKTPFYSFGRDANPNSDFITRKFKAKYNEETGWKLTEGLF